MANDWIKMRGSLVDHPKVIAITQHLLTLPEFREWLTTPDAQRCVTTSLLMRVWSIARETGKFDAENLRLPHSALVDIDQLARAPGIGEAMKLVGWALEDDGVTLPNFSEFNMPLSVADSQRKYRSRVASKLSTERSNNVITRTEQNRTDKKKDVVEFRSYFDERLKEAWKAWLEVRSRVRAPNTPRALKIALDKLEGLRIGGNDPLAVVEQSIINGYRGLFPVKPSLGQTFGGAPAPAPKPCAKCGGELSGYTRMQIGNVCSKCRRDYMNGKWREKSDGTWEETNAD